MSVINGCQERRNVKWINVTPYLPESEYIKKINKKTLKLLSTYKYLPTKTNEMSKMTWEVKMLSSKLKFIEYKMNGNIRVENVNYEDILSNLVDLGFEKFGMYIDDKRVDFKYITDITIFDLSRGEIEKLNKRILEINDRIKDH